MSQIRIIAPLLHVAGRRHHHRITKAAASRCMILKYATGRIMARLAPSRPVWLFRRGVIVRLARRELAWINVTAYPTAEWCCGHAPITS